MFSAPMVNAILEGRKTQTRRMVKGAINHQAEKAQCFYQEKWDFLRYDGLRLQTVKCPLGTEGDRLWVRETFVAIPELKAVCYRANESQMHSGPWTPSIFMPRWASRIDLEITNIRIERLQDISEEDAVAEGIYHDHETKRYHYLKRAGAGLVNPEDAFHVLWDTVNGKSAWAANPWVWVYEFRRIEK